MCAYLCVCVCVFLCLHTDEGTKTEVVELRAYVRKGGKLKYELDGVRWKSSFVKVRGCLCVCVWACVCVCASGLSEERHTLTGGPQQITSCLCQLNPSRPIECPRQSGPLVMHVRDPPLSLLLLSLRCAGWQR